MKKRLEALEKIERLHRQMHDLMVWRLTALGRERGSLVEDHRQMLAAMEGGVLAYGAPAAAADLELAAQQRRAVAQGARAKLADRAREGVEALYRDQKERKDLAELIDVALRNPKSSPA